MAYGFYAGLHGQRKHRLTRRGLKAHYASKKAYRKMMRKPKRVVAKAYANAVGQIVYKSGRTRPSHGGRRFGRSYGRRRFY